MNQRATWRLAAIAGFASFVAALFLTSIEGLQLCGPSTVANPLFAFELVRDPAEAAALFGTDPCRGMAIAAQTQALMLRALALTPAYTLFLLLSVFALRGRLRGIAPFAGLAVVAAAALDEIGCNLALGLLRDMPPDAAAVDTFYLVVRAKYAALAPSGIAIGLMLARKRWFGTLAAVPVLAGSVIAFWLLLVNPHSDAFPATFIATWGALFAVALIEALFGRAEAPPRRRRRPARSA